jgi:hypothetical protein
MNIRWIFMFFDRAKSSRNIINYVPQPQDSSRNISHEVWQRGLVEEERSGGRGVLGRGLLPMEWVVSEERES